MTDSILAWHFAGTRMRDGSPLGAPEQTEEYYNGELSLCESGLHASFDIRDALTYAPGPLLRRVRLSGNKLVGDDKLCASRREVLWEVDMSGALRTFARRCALDVAHLWSAQDFVLYYLTTGDETARTAAEAAAWAAARAAAMATAGSAAWAKQTKRLENYAYAARAGLFTKYEINDFT